MEKNLDKRDILPVEKWEELLVRKGMVERAKEGIQEEEMMENRAQCVLRKLREASRKGISPEEWLSALGNRMSTCVCWELFSGDVVKAHEMSYGTHRWMRVEELEPTLRRRENTFDQACEREREMVNNAEKRDVLTAETLQELLQNKAAIVLASDRVRQCANNIKHFRWTIEHSKKAGESNEKLEKKYEDEKRKKAEAVQEREKKENVFHQACGRMWNGEMASETEMQDTLCREDWTRIPNLLVPKRHVVGGVNVPLYPLVTLRSAGDCRETWGADYNSWNDRDRQR